MHISWYRKEKKKERRNRKKNRKKNKEKIRKKICKIYLPYSIVTLSLKDKKVSMKGFFEGLFVCFCFLFFGGEKAFFLLLLSLTSYSLLFFFLVFLSSGPCVQRMRTFGVRVSQKESKKKKAGYAWRTNFTHWRVCG